MGKKKPTKQDVIKVWKELDIKSEKPVGVNALCREIGLKPYHVTQLFQGEDLTEVKKRHKIRTAPQETPYTQDALLEKYDSVVTKLKKIPTWNKIRFITHITENTFRRRFKRTNDLKRDIVTEYEKWLQKHKPESQNLKIVKKWLKGEDKPVVSPSVVKKSKGGTNPSIPKNKWENIW